MWRDRGGHRPAIVVRRARVGAHRGTREGRFANERPGVALIGCGGMGIYDAGNCRGHGDIVAVCDVDQSHVARAIELFGKDGKVPKGYSDFRKLLERDDVHVIVNGCL